MHKLGNVLTTDEKKEEIGKILTARRNLYNAGIALLECDNIYAENVKSELEKHTFAGHIANFEEDETGKKQIDETDIRFYLEMRMRIYVKEENITIDIKNGVCKIRLNDTLTANIPIKSGTAVRSILL